MSNNNSQNELVTLCADLKPVSYRCTHRRWNGANALTVLDKGTEWRPDEVFSSTCTSAILDESRASSLGTAFESLKHGTSLCSQLVFCEKRIHELITTLLAKRLDITYCSPSINAYWKLEVLLPKTCLFASPCGNFAEIETCIVEGVHENCLRAFFKSVSNLFLTHHSSYEHFTLQRFFIA